MLAEPEADEARADEAGAAGDHDPHAGSMAFRVIPDRRGDVPDDVRIRIVRRSAAMVAVLLVGIVFLSSLALAATQAVTIVDFNFEPRTITINAGDSVTWTNNGGDPHTATSNTGAFDTGVLNPGASKTFAFAIAGTYQYHCAIHTFMTGTVTVVAAAATTAPPTPTPPPPPPTTAPPAATTAAATAAPTAVPTTAAPTAAPTTAT